METFGWKTLGGNVWVAACAQCWTANDPLLDYYGKSCSPLITRNFDIPHYVIGSGVEGKSLLWTGGISQLGLVYGS